MRGAALVGERAVRHVVRVVDLRAALELVGRQPTPSRLKSTPSASGVMSSAAQAWSPRTHALEDRRGPPRPGSTSFEPAAAHSLGTTSPSRRRPWWSGAARRPSWSRSSAWSCSTSWRCRRRGRGRRTPAATVSSVVLDERGCRMSTTTGARPAIAARTPRPAGSATAATAIARRGLRRRRAAHPDLVRRRPAGSPDDGSASSRHHGLVDGGSASSSGSLMRANPTSGLAPGDVSGGGGPWRCG